MIGTVPPRTRPALRAVLAGLLAAGLLGSLAAQAQVIHFTDVQTGNRQVTVTWNKHPGDSLSVDDRLLIPERQFAGYRIWRSETADTTDWQLLRTYSMVDSTWSWKGDERVFVDPDSIIARGTERDPDADENPIPGPFNGFQYHYALTWFDASLDTTVVPPDVTEYPVQTIQEGTYDEAIYPSKAPVETTPLLSRVKVVPNPFNPAADFQRQTFRGESRVQFINLPSPARVDVYTVAGDMVISLDHRDQDDSLDWDLKNNDGEDVTSGVYLYFVRADSGEETNGKFVIIR